MAVVPGEDEEADGDLDKRVECVSRRARVAAACGLTLPWQSGCTDGRQ